MKLLLGLLIVLTSGTAFGSWGYPETSWVVVKASSRHPTSADPKRGLVRVSVSVDAPKQPGKVVVRAYSGRRDGSRLGFSDIDFVTKTVTTPGEADFVVDLIDAQSATLITVSAPGFLPGAVAVMSGDLEIEFILVPELSR
jgi:hypothetical protein